MEERRRYPRLNTHYLAWYRHYGHIKQHDYKLVSLRNVSIGGALFISDEELRINSNIEISLKIPKIEQIFLPATVLRIDKVKNSNLNFFYGSC